MRTESLTVHDICPVDRHLDDFPVFLETTDTSWKRFDLLESRIIKLIEHVDAKRLSNLTTSAVLSTIVELRRPGVLIPRSLSAQTATHYVRTI